MGVICLILQLAFWAIIVWVVLSYVVNFGRLPWGHPVRTAYDTLSRGIDPVLRPIRSAIPPVRFGGVGLDLSPLILIIGLSLLRRIIC
ncbi:MAG TPA: YggT family protein [Acidimicrobiia bacterium]|jgi:YggT family protein